MRSFFLRRVDNSCVSTFDARRRAAKSVCYTQQPENEADATGTNDWWRQPKQEEQVKQRLKFKRPLSPTAKKRLARLVALPLMQRLMGVAINVTVPRHRVGVGAVVFNAAGEVLLLRHVFHPHTPWGVPSGWLDRNEDPAACALRELREETGLSARLGPIIQSTFSPEVRSINLFYLAFGESGPVTLSFEILEARWFAPADLPSPLLPMVESAIARGAERVARFGRKSASPTGVTL